MTDGRIDAQVEKMDAVVMDVCTDKQKPQKADPKSHNSIKVVLGALLCLSLCGNVGSSAAAFLASKETWVKGGVLSEGRDDRGFRLLPDHEDQTQATQWPGPVGCGLARVDWGFRLRRD